MKYKIKNFEIDITHKLTKEEQIAFVARFLSDMYNKDRIKLLRNFNIPNRTKINKSFSESRTKWDFNINKVIDNPLYNYEFRTKFSEELLNVADFDTFIVNSLILDDNNIYFKIKRVLARYNIKSQLDIKTIMKIDFTNNEYKLPTIKEETNEDLSDI